MAKRTSVEPRKRPTQQRSRATVEAVLEAAAYILVREGYERTTTNRIAERAGVNIASLYQYFPHKDALVAELLRRHVELTETHILRELRALPGADLRSTLQAVITAGIAEHAVSPALHRVFTEQRGHPGPDAAPSRGEVELRDEVRRAVTNDACGVPDLEFALWLVEVVLHAAVHQATIERPDDVQSGRVASELLALLMPYLVRR